MVNKLKLWIDKHCPKIPVGFAGGSKTWELEWLSSHMDKVPKKYKEEVLKMTSEYINDKKQASDYNLGTNTSAYIVISPGYFGDAPIVKPIESERHEMGE